MENKYRVKKAVIAAFTALVLCLSLVTSTYAWFTSNSRTETSRVSAKTNTEGAALLVGGSKDSLFEGTGTLVQLNDSKTERLTPVSTADLKSFVQCAAFADGNATAFYPVEDEKGLYHGRIYLKPEYYGEGDRAVALYFDLSGENIAENDEQSALLSAARLGLFFDEGKPLIFALSDEAHTESREGNTRLNGELLKADKVLTLLDGKVLPADDPVCSLIDYSIQSEEAKPLAIIKAGTVCSVDVYFYLEGCDPDCRESLSFHGGSLQLSFFGVLLEEAHNG